jgi:predicted dehydrogenase/serine acetyltransferase
MWGRNLARTMRDLGVLAAVVDPDDLTATAVAEQHGVEPRSLSDVVEDDSIDAAVVAAPAAHHARLALQLLEAGKHVFVEKPLALDLADAERVKAAADASGRILMVGHLLQYHPAFRALERLAHGGAFGRLQYIYSHRLNLGRIRREENALWSFAPHDISMILRLAGEQPADVTAIGARFLHTVVTDVTTTHLAFPSGVRAHVFVSWLHPYKEQRLVVVGDQGMAVFDDGQPWDRKLVRYSHRIDWSGGLPTPSKADATPVEVEPEEPLKVECEHFLDCCRTGVRPRTDGNEGIAVLRVLERAQRSMDGPTRHGAGPPWTHPGVHESAYIDEGVEIGGDTRIWHFTHVLPGSRIGRACSIGQNVSIGPRVSIGDRCKIQNNVSVYEGVTLEDGVFCGPSAVFTNVVNPRAEIDRRSEFAPTIVRQGATIGANATIVCGHSIGKYAFVAAGAVVTSDVADYALMAGVPARRIGWMSAAGERLGDDLTCPRTGRKYREEGPDRLVELP